MVDMNTIINKSDIQLSFRLQITGRICRILLISLQGLKDDDIIFVCL